LSGAEGELRPTELKDALAPADGTISDAREAATAFRFFDGGTLKRDLRESSWMIFLMTVAAVFSCIYIYSHKLAGPPIRSDGYGYYAYLTSIFIDHDLGLASARAHIPVGTLDQYGIAEIDHSGRYIDRYSIGTALLQMPFFLAAHTTAGFFGFKRDGYSSPYQVANTASAIVYLCVGCFFLYAACRIHFAKVVSASTCLLIVFATNVFHYATYDASFSHVYQFSLLSICTWLGMRYEKADDRGQTVLCVAFGVITGLITLTRLTNAIVLLLPAALILKKYVDTKNIRNLATNVAIVALISSLLVGLEIAYLRHVTGHWIVNAYAVTYEKTAFHWLHPEILKFLFSVRKGVFFWTPVLLVATVGFIPAMRRFPWWTIASATVIAAHFYVCASWYSWSFGGSYGSRPVVDVMPLFAVPLAVVIDELIRSRRTTLASSGAAIIVTLNVILMYSYWHYYIPFDGVDAKALSELPAKLWTSFKR
jgi:hypothetical protein